MGGLIIFARLRPTATATILTLAVCYSPVQQAAEDNWQFTVVFPMIWAPDISGELDIDGTKQDIDISFSEILENLEAGLIGELYAQRGNWSIGWRSMFLGTESKTITGSVGIPGRPPIVGQHEITINTELFTSDIVGGYQLSQNFGLYTGIRRTGTKIKVKYKPLEDSPIFAQGRVTPADEELFDWIVGVDFSYPLSKKWELAAQLDYGVAGDNDTDIQLNAVATYKLNHRHSAWLGYRYLEIGDSTTSEGSKIKTSFSQSGPTLGWAFTF